MYQKACIYCVSSCFPKHCAYLVSFGVEAELKGTKEGQRVTENSRADIVWAFGELSSGLERAQIRWGKEDFNCKQQRYFLTKGGSYPKCVPYRSSFVISIGYCSHV